MKHRTIMNLLLLHQQHSLDMVQVIIITTIATTILIIIIIIIITAITITINWDNHQK